MKKRCNPYDYSEVTKLLMYFYSLGWYSKRLDLLTIVMQGEFEGFTDKASETWEHRFCVSNCAIQELHIMPHEVCGATIGEACEKLLKVIVEEKESGQVP